MKSHSSTSSRVWAWIVSIFMIAGIIINPISQVIVRAEQVPEKNWEESIPVDLQKWDLPSNCEIINVGGASVDPLHLTAISYQGSHIYNDRTTLDFNWDHITQQTH